ANGANYQEQEAANRASLAGAAAPAALTPQLPSGAPPVLPPPSVPAPSLGAPPASGKAIAQLIHSGAGASGLHAAAAQIRRHATDLRSTAIRLRAGASSLAGDWD